MKKIIVIIALLGFSCQAVISQDSELEKYLKRREGIKYPNIIKINTIAIPFSNISLAYERGLAQRVSLSIGAGYKYAGDLPRLFESYDQVFTIQMNEIQGYSITPELRYYVRSCDTRKLDGFYFGLYGRHTHYETQADFTYQPEEGPMEQTGAQSKLNEFGVGLSLGYQFILWERLSVDFLFFGPRYSVTHIGYEFDPPPSQEFLDDLAETINTSLDRFGFDYTVDLKQEGEGSASTSFNFTNVRFGISLGFAF